MNPNLCAIVLRPRTPLEVFDLSLVLLRDRGFWVGVVTLLVGCLFWLPLWPLMWWTKGHLAWLLVPVLAMPFTQPLYSLLFGRLLFSPNVPIMDVLRAVPGVAMGVLGVSLIRVFAWLFSSLTCFVLLLPALVLTAYLDETAVLERVGADRGARRSAKLALGHPGLAFATVTGRFFLWAWGGAVGEMAGQALFTYVLQLGSPFGSAMNGQVTPFLLGGLLFVQPLMALYRMLLYVDVRTRLEGWDLQVGLMAMAARSETP